MSPARPSRGAVEARYRDRRVVALRRAEEIALEALAPFPVHLDLVNATALHAFREQWEGNPRRRYPWPWAKMAEDAKKNEPDRFEVAVWSGMALCGLAIGWTRQTFCRVDFLEGSPDKVHPLKGHVAAIVASAATAYAIAIDREEIRLMDPIPAVVPHYEALGFTLATPLGGSPYCWWMVT